MDECSPYRMSVESYYQLNRERVLAKVKQPVTCQCGAVVKYGNLPYHRKSVKHLIYEQSTRSNAIHHQTLHTGAS